MYVIDFPPVVFHLQRQRDSSLRCGKSLTAHILKRRHHKRRIDEQPVQMCEQIQPERRAAHRKEQKPAFPAVPKPGNAFLPIQIPQAKHRLQADGQIAHQIHAELPLKTIGQGQQKKQADKAKNAPMAERQPREHGGEKRKLSFKEKREMEALEADIAALEAEKKAIEDALCSGMLGVAELTEKSKRLPLLNEELDGKSMRWLELSEIEG